MKIVLRTLYALFLSLDLLLSALTFGAPLQTLSARFARWRDKKSKIGTWLANATDKVALKVFHQHNHCGGALAAYDARVAASPSWSG